MIQALVDGMSTLWAIAALGVVKASGAAALLCSTPALLPLPSLGVGLAAAGWEEIVLMLANVHLSCNLVVKLSARPIPLRY